MPDRKQSPGEESPAHDCTRNAPGPNRSLNLEGNQPIKFADLAHIIADGMWPASGPDDDRMDYGLARLRLDSELADDARARVLTVRSPLTLNPETFLHGAALNSTVILPVEDLAPYLMNRGMIVNIRPATRDEHPPQINAGELAPGPALELVPVPEPAPALKQVIEPEPEPAWELEPVINPAPAIEPEPKSRLTSGTLHALRITRTNVLAPVIEEAKKLCADPHNVAQVWTQLEHLAEQKRPPLIGAAEGTLKYQDGGDVKLLSRRNLKDRMRAKKAL